LRYLRQRPNASEQVLKHSSA